ncbi:MAG: sigma-70 family RNA polymerase sigma factor [Planctomycetes bacterium]|nr:sigma-70 family RNA polymerase sigma factor [Planctomycetota bacterium]
MRSARPTSTIDSVDAPGEDARSTETLLPVVYDELRRLADHYLRGERAGHTLQATALVHEAWLRLQDAPWQNRAHFMGVAAMAMRRVLVNHAKGRDRLKRGGGKAPIVLEETMAVFEDRAIDLVALDDALTRLAEIDPEQARIVELRFFAGLTVEETAQLLGTSVRTVHRDWAMARAWLHGEIAEGEA